MKSTLPAEVRKNFFGRFAVLDMEIAKSFWFSSRVREENAAQAIEKGKENLFSFPFSMAWADRESPKEILCQQNDAKSAPTLSRKVLGGVGTFFQEGSDRPRNRSFSNILPDKSQWV